MPAQSPAAIEEGQGERPGALAAVGLLFRGILDVLRAPRRWPIAYAPVVIAAALLAIAVGGASILGWNAVRHFFAPPSGASPFLAALLILVGVALWLGLSVLALSSLASAVGGPFWERLSDDVERDAGAADVVRPDFALRRFASDVVESGALFVAWLACAGAVFLVGFIPAVGVVAAPAMQLAVGGFFLAVELTRPALTRRGMRLRQRLGFTWRHRGPVLAFGVGAFALFLVPPMSLLAMPGAVVGATRLVRRLEGSTS